MTCIWVSIWSFVNLKGACIKPALHTNTDIFNLLLSKILLIYSQMPLRNIPTGHNRVNVVQFYLQHSIFNRFIFWNRQLKSQNLCLFNSSLILSAQCWTASRSSNSNPLLSRFNFNIYCNLWLYDTKHALIYLVAYNIWTI